jgi:hypothetical protein
MNENIEDLMYEFSNSAEEKLKYVNTAITECSDLNCEERVMHGNTYVDKYVIRLCKVRDALNAIVKSSTELFEFVAPA